MTTFLTLSFLALSIFAAVKPNRCPGKRHTRKVLNRQGLVYPETLTRNWTS